MTYVLVFLQSSEINFMEILSKDVKRPFILPTIDLWCSDGTAVRESFHKYLYSSFSSFLHIQLFQKRREASCSASESHGCRSWGRQGGQGEGELASSHHLNIMPSCHHVIMSSCHHVIMPSCHHAMPGDSCGGRAEGQPGAAGGLQHHRREFLRAAAQISAGPQIFLCGCMIWWLFFRHWTQYLQRRIPP